MGSIPAEGTAAAITDWVYMVRCADGSLYTGWTTNLAQRLQHHNKGTGAKYTRSRRPVTLVYCEVHGDRSSALRREAAIKSLSRSQKLALIATQQMNPIFF